MVTCGIGTGKSHCPGKPHADASPAATFSGIVEPNNTALLATAARLKKLRRDNAAMTLEGAEVLFISVHSLSKRFRVFARIVFCTERSARRLQWRYSPQKGASSPCHSSEHE